jgi:AAA ATPase domain
VLIGRCSEQEAVPLLPFVEILEASVEAAEAADDLRRVVGDEGPELARMLPRVRRMIPDLPQAQELEARAARRVLFESVCNFLARCAHERPALIVVEDLHWADASTLDLFSHISQHHAEIPMLLIGTHRSSESDLGPALAQLLEDLVRGRMATQLGLTGLSASDVAAMLKGLSGQAPPPAVVAEFTAETDGNPFFIEELFRHLAEEHRLYDSAGRYTTNLKIEELEVPRNVRLVVGRRFARLGEATRRILGAAAVIGRSFTLELLEAATDVKAAELLDDLDEAARIGLVRSSRDYPDARSEFSHELIRQVVLGHLSGARRQRLHLEVANAIERQYSLSLQDHYAELANHYSQSSDTAKAAYYLCLAGRRALESSAHAEASVLLAAGLEKLNTLPESPDRDRIELPAQLALGILMIAIKGFGAKEVERAYTRASELCRRSNDREHLIIAVNGLAQHHMLRSHLSRGMELGKEVLTLSRETDSPIRLAGVFFNFAMPSFWLGDLKAAREYLEKVLALEDRLAHDEITIGSSITSALQYLAWTLWHMGYPAQGLTAAQRALAIARERKHAFSLAGALNQVARFHVLRREPAIALELADEGLEFSNRMNFPTWSGESNLVRGWAMAQLGREEEGIAAMRAGLAIREAIHEYGAQPHYQAWLAEALSRVGAVQEGLDLVEWYLDRKHEVLVYEPEIHLVRASLYLAQQRTHTAKATRSIEAAIEVAKGFGGRSLELRATTALARLLAREGHCEKARTILGEIYNWFTEGYDTADLKDAKALLDELSR